jgi:hypothetical protein
MQIDICCILRQEHIVTFQPYCKFSGDATYNGTTNANDVTSNYYNTIVQYRFLSNSVNTVPSSESFNNVSLSS